MRIETPTLAKALPALLSALLLFAALPAAAELNGSCALLAPKFGNPGLGCARVGTACTINGAAGTCTNMKRPIESLIYCVCSPNGSDVPQEVEAKAVARAAIAPGCGQVITFDVDQTTPHIVDIAFPQPMGGAVARIEAFSGSFTVVTTVIPGDPNHCGIQIESGQFVAESFLLPDGRITGPNTYKFQSGIGGNGTLDLTTGKYTTSALGVMTNNLYPNITTNGMARGTVDFAAGTITIDTTTLDNLNALPQPLFPTPLEPTPTQK